ncbi:hypothetical protein KK141_09965 [Dyella sp. LX-66]|uniref:hypothetical protein n=1 Tax=unclassified Dyella TaxID=2634549 RepID=UPI001BE06754|nr:MULTISPECIES: hypothetical protein [unclassified Dyella]MBT2117067.1 hypothetical protein [Dyella sp. LX-1]MBT2139857.1 hypothetical protein [Dyella sp. LX-66]
MRIAKFVIAALGVASIGAGSLYAFNRPTMPLNEKAARSTLVFFGTVKEANYRDLRLAGNERAALVRIDKVLKGAPGDDVQIIWTNGIAELSLDCCVAGGRYLFFVAANQRGLYESVSGADGVYRIDM